VSPHKIVSKGIGHVPQGRHIFPTLSVIDNLMMGAYLHRKAKKEIGKDLEWIYQLLPILRERTRQRAGTLSGGEQQMLSIGMALMTRPKLLLLDEPLLGLSPAMQNSLIQAVKQIRKEGITVLVAEQFARPLLPIVDRGYVIENGMLTLQGSGQELRENPEVRSTFMGV
jgi:branched-chain amino acid transport system ATP-binding protein